jgi:hypothetical protein
VLRGGQLCCHHSLKVAVGAGLAGRAPRAPEEVELHYSQLASMNCEMRRISLLMQFWLNQRTKVVFCRACTVFWETCHQPVYEQYHRHYTASRATCHGRHARCPAASTELNSHCYWTTSPMVPNPCRDKGWPQDCNYCCLYRNAIYGLTLKCRPTPWQRQ